MSQQTDYRLTEIDTQTEWKVEVTLSSTVHPHRHSILKQCKMDDILVPMTRGNMEDIENEGREGGESALEYSSGLNTQVGEELDDESGVLLFYFWFILFLDIFEVV